MDIGKVSKQEKTTNFQVEVEFVKANPNMH